MIVNKNTKGFQTRSDKPNENWLNDNNYFVVEDGSELAQKIISNYPNIELVIKNNKLVDVKITEPEPIPEPTETVTTDDILNTLLGVTDDE